MNKQMQENIDLRVEALKASIEKEMNANTALIVISGEINDNGDKRYLLITKCDENVDTSSMLSIYFGMFLHGINELSNSLPISHEHKISLIKLISDQLLKIAEKLEKQ